MRKQRKIEQMEKKLKKQIELNNELNRKIEEKCDTNCIENEYNQLIMTIDTTFSNNLNFNVMEEMNNLINFQMIKSWILKFIIILFSNKKITLIWIL